MFIGRFRWTPSSSATKRKMGDSWYSVSRYSLWRTRAPWHIHASQLLPGVDIPERRFLAMVSISSLLTSSFHLLCPSFGHLDPFYGRMHAQDRSCRGCPCEGTKMSKGARHWLTFENDERLYFRNIGRYIVKRDWHEIERNSILRARRGYRARAQFPYFLFAARSAEWMKGI